MYAAPLQNKAQRWGGSGLGPGTLYCPAQMSEERIKARAETGRRILCSGDLAREQSRPNSARSPRDFQNLSETAGTCSPSLNTQQKTIAGSAAWQAGDIQPTGDAPALRGALVAASCLRAPGIPAPSHRAAACPELITHLCLVLLRSMCHLLLLLPKADVCSFHPVSREDPSWREDGRWTRCVCSAMYCYYSLI